MMSIKKTKKLVIFGTGEIGSLAKYYFQHDSEYQVVAFTADDEFVAADTFERLPLIPVSKLKEKFSPSETEVHVALSYKRLNQVRASKYSLVKSMGYTLASYVCSKSAVWEDLQIGDNCFILENQTIQPTVKIGNDVMIWSGNHLGHGLTIEDHTYISSHVCIAGNTRIGSHCFLGVNSTIKDFVKIGDRVFVAMGAVITCNVPDDSVVIGAKSEILDPESRKATYIKKIYLNL